MLFQALSVASPAGSLIRSGRKTIEVRRWQPDTLPLRDLLIVQNNTALSDENPEDPAGGIVALVDVVTVRPWQAEDLEKSGRTQFEEGWLAWELENVRPAAYNRFVPAKLRIYEVEVNPKYLMHPDGSFAILRLQEESPEPTDAPPAE